jgi:acetyl esterase/lipase
MQKLRDAGRAVKLLIYPDLPHAFLGMDKFDDVKHFHQTLIDSAKLLKEVMASASKCS